MHVPFAEKKIELLLCKMRIDFRKWNHVERQIPGGEPRIFPLVRHRDDVPVEKMRPLPVPTELSLRRRQWLRRVACQPVANDVIIKLFAPEQSGVTLARDFLRLLIHLRGNKRVIKFVRLFNPLSENPIEISKWIRRRFVLCGKPQLHDLRLSWFDLQDVMRRKFCAGLCGIHRVCPPMHDIFVKRVFHKGPTVRITVKTQSVRLVLSEERRRVALVSKLIFAKLIVVNMGEAVTFQRD